MFTSSPARPFAPIVLSSLVALFGACSQTGPAPSQGNGVAAPTATATPANSTAQGPSIEASPVEKSEGGYQFFSSDNATLTVRAPGAREVRILYQPVGSDEQFIELATLTQPADASAGEFRAQFRPPADFNGEVWARASYPDGGDKETDHVSLASKDEAASVAAQQNGQSGGQPNGQAGAQTQQQVKGVTVNSDDSARSDRVTGGHIEHAAFKPGDGDISISVNVPAFLLTLWQDGKEVAVYHVGVGQKKYPIKIGERKANQIVLNPTWIPPDSKWVKDNLVGEHITADDPRNPLGKVKIPLGDAYLIHQAESPSDIGHLVSHGCVRLLQDDLFDLATKIAQARGVSNAAQDIEQAKQNTDRKILRLGEPVPVDINYDTTVVEGGVLHIYPDVYDRDANTPERLRSALQAAGVDDSKLGDDVLRQMLGRVSRSEQFVVSVADIKSGHALDRGQTQPLTPNQQNGKGQKAGGGRPRKRRAR
jgi:lipoprotein-anchoring transpeptidase ErfK/SrfK